MHAAGKFNNCFTSSLLPVRTGLDVVLQFRMACTNNWIGMVSSAASIDWRKSASSDKPVLRTLALCSCDAISAVCDLYRLDPWNWHLARYKSDYYYYYYYWLQMTLSFYSNIPSSRLFGTVFRRRFVARPVFILNVFVLCFFFVYCLDCIIWWGTAR